MSYIKQLKETTEECERLVSEKEYGADELLHEVNIITATVYNRLGQHKEFLELYINYFLKFPEFNSTENNLKFSQHDYESF